MAGYSKTPLAKKLGIKPATMVHVVHPPNGYADLLAPMPDGAKIRPSESKDLPADAQFVHLFAANRDALERELPSAKNALAKAATLWISWPKKAAKALGVDTDLDGGQVRKAGQDIGLVDVKVCAVDEVWSGHKFVYRLADR